MWNWLALRRSRPARRSCSTTARPSSPMREHDPLGLRREEGITVFGTSAKYIDAMSRSSARAGGIARSLRAARDDSRPAARSRPSIRSTTSTRREEDLHLASISGGTDIVSCFVLGNPLLPVWRGEIQCRGSAWPSTSTTTRAIRSRGRRASWSARAVPVDARRLLERSRRREVPRGVLRALPGVWRHGDWMEITAHGGVVIHGRSDATLNPGGVRIGTAEIYRQVEQLPEVLESVVIGQDWGQRRARRAVRAAARRTSARRRAREGASRNRSARNTTPRHVPARSSQVATSRARRAARSPRSPCATWCTAGR
jgi:acetoacetyl-CoA synthetase